MNQAAARAERVTKVYGWGDTRVTALDELSVSFDRGAVHSRNGAIRLGQVDPHALHCRARRSDGRDRLTSVTGISRP